MISSEERQSISNYKSYASNYLVTYKYLADYWVPDFNIQLNTDKNVYFDYLAQYLDNLSLYYKHIKKYAELRQKHYTSFIFNIKEEEEGHKYWREALNKIVTDAKEKLARWSNIKNNVFDYLISNYTAELPDISIVNVDYFPDEEENNNVKINININDDEIEMRKILLEKKLAKEIENSIFLEEAIKIRQEYNYYIFVLFNEKITIRDFYDSYDKEKFFLRNYHKLFFEPHDYLIGSDAEIKKLFTDTMINMKKDFFYYYAFIFHSDIRFIKLLILRIINIMESYKFNKSFIDIKFIYNELISLISSLIYNPKYFYSIINNPKLIDIPDSKIY